MIKLLWQFVIIAAPIAIYLFVIRPRLKARWTDLYTDIGGFWARQWARLVAFRSWVIGGAGIYMSEVPALLEEFKLADLTFLPERWQSTIRVVTIVALMLARAYSTTPQEQPPTEEK